MALAAAASASYATHSFLLPVPPFLAAADALALRLQQFSSPFPYDPSVFFEAFLLVQQLIGGLTAMISLAIALFVLGIQDLGYAH